MSAPTPLTADLLRTLPLPWPGEATDKDARGRVIVVGGSAAVPGGARLAAEAALRAGAGKLQVATAASVAPHLGVALPEALVLGLEETPAGGIAPAAAAAVLHHAGHCDAVLLGPGMLDAAATAALTGALVEGLDYASLVLDAGALVDLRQHRAALRRHAGRVILTPHAGEMAAMLDLSRDAVEADPLAAARQAAAELQCLVVMKGGSTHVVTPQGEAWLYRDGPVGLATSGSGDTLAGIIVGLLARGAAPARAALWGVYLHGEAGRRLSARIGPLGFLAREIPPEVPRILAEFSPRA